MDTFVRLSSPRSSPSRRSDIGQPEVGVGVNPCGGGTERLPLLIGRGRANDFDGDTAERYGYVNRALPDTELDRFVDALARRVTSFDRRAIAAAKNLVNEVSLPSADQLLDGLNSFTTALTWPETQQRIQALFKRGLQREGGFENQWTRCSARSSTRSHRTAFSERLKFARRSQFKSPVLRGAFEFCG
jgi:hypothetical protein